MKETWVIEGKLERNVSEVTAQYCHWQYIGFSEDGRRAEDGRAFPTDKEADAYQGTLDEVITKFTASNWNPSWVFKLTCLQTKESIPTEIFV